MINASESILRRRRIVNTVVLTLALLATGVGLFSLAAILWTLLQNGLAALSLDLFTQATPPPGLPGGLANAIVGSLIMTILAILLAAPIGILAGTYLSEYGRHGPMTQAVRFVNDILLSAPSIVIGLFVYTIMVAPVGQFSGWAGMVALAIIAIPIVVRTAEDMLSLVPNTLREAAVALGASKWRVTTMIIYRAAFQGMLTGVLLAIARISGETAPLLFTALNNQFWSGTMSGPTANLPVTIYQFALSPYADWRQLAWGGALLITAAVLILNIVARSLGGLTRMPQSQ